MTFAVCDKNSRYFPQVKQELERIIPDEKKLKMILEKVGDVVDRFCEVFVEKNVPVGFIVYKKEPAKHLGVNYLDLCFLSLIEPAKNQGKGHKETLVNKAIQIANERFCSYISIDVSKSDRCSLDFLKNKEFLSEPTQKDSEGEFISLIYKVKEQINEAELMEPPFKKPSMAFRAIKPAFS